MEKTVKILLIACFILVVGVGVAVGFILQSNSLENVQPAVSVLNQSNSTTGIKNNTTSLKNNITGLTVNNTTTHGQKTNYIGKTAAKRKAINFLTEMDVIDTTEIKSVDLVTINGVPLYRVRTYNHYITVYGTETGLYDIYIGAKNGRLYDDDGELVTT